MTTMTLPSPTKKAAPAALRFDKPLSAWAGRLAGSRRPGSPGSSLGSGSTPSSPAR